MNSGYGPQPSVTFSVLTTSTDPHLQCQCFHFLVDTGSEITLIPSRFIKTKLDPNNETVFAANKSVLHIEGTILLTFFINNHRFTWRCYVADIVNPILGADFLHHFQLTVDVANRRLFHSKENIVTCSTTAHSSSPLVPEQTLVEEHYDNLSELLDSFPEVFAKPLFHNRPPPGHTFTHSIILDELYKPAKPYPIPHPLQDEANRLIQEMIASGILIPSHSQFAAPLLLKKKKDGTQRPCVDFRRLNAATRHDPYPIPTAKDIFNNLTSSKHFAVFDFTSGYWQIPMHPSDRHKTAVVTPKGLYEFTRMPFGLRNAAQTFQRMMNHFIQDLPNCMAYIDDIIIHAPTQADLIKFTRQMLVKCRQWKLHLRRDKVQFGTSVQYLGHTVSADGILPMNSNVDPILNFAQPQTRCQLRRFLGMINFYRNYLPNIAWVLAPLHQLSSPKYPFKWTQDHERAFSAAKTLLAHVTALHWPQGDLTLTTDASIDGVGAVLASHGKPVAFASHAFSETEKRYATIERELHAIVWSQASPSLVKYDTG